MVGQDFENTNWIEEDRFRELRSCGVAETKAGFLESCIDESLFRSLVISFTQSGNAYT